MLLCFCPDWKMSAYPYKHFSAILKFRSHMWLQQPCHIWGETLYSSSSQLETLTIAGKNFILNVAGFLGPPVFINIAVLKFFQKNYHWLLSKFQSNVSLFTINIHVILKIVQTAWLHEKLRLKKSKQKIPFILLPVWMGRLDATLLQSYKKIFFPRDLFVLTLNDCLWTLNICIFSGSFRK